MKLTEFHSATLRKLLIIDDARERLAAVVDRGKHAKPLAAEFCTTTFRVEGCISQVWLVPELRAGKCYFTGQADSPIMQGLLVLLCEFYSGHSPEEVAGVEPDFLEKAGLLAQLTPTRRNGISVIRDRIRRLAQQG